MAEPIEHLIEAFCDALQPKAGIESFIVSAEAEGYPQVAKLFRAVVASQASRERLLRESLPNHIAKVVDYFVCPYCGLIYEPDAPEQCLADQTPAESFLRIH